MFAEITYWFRVFLLFAFDINLQVAIFTELEAPSIAKRETSLTSFNNTSEIRHAITEFLQHCNLPFPVTNYDTDFHDACCREARRKGYPMDSTYPGCTSLYPFIPGGVVMATTAYSHLHKQDARIFIALYTAFLIYLDDIFQKDVGLVSEFNERFIHKRAQLDPVLDSFADLLYELPQHFGRVVSNIMVTSTLNLVTALLLEHETQDMTLSPYAHGYTTFSRVMSGASEVYALFAFPTDIPLQGYIQALHDMTMFINNGNDILSFYKEDLAGENVNRISNLANCFGTSKLEVLRRLSEDASTYHSQVMQILEPCPAAFEAYSHFSKGYIGFHASLSRYRLGELFG
ncbi:isoprenoid synthase domain-containing protein [Crucibulum laeve]|uniref:Isoprenoid synthase domain-containing protein n=1 Tax=Crucibulum laeve TaxID=68775 RepID=A0A5C3LZZ6_9AGAR|nr:isoprenoid synthase domain-containing protein [Crucibulum laeve]